MELPPARGASTKTYCYHQNANRLNEPRSLWVEHASGLLGALFAKREDMQEFRLIEIGLITCSPTRYLN